MTQTETLRLALEYVELVPDDRYNADHIDRDALITAIKATLSGEAQTRSVVKDEPAAWMNKYGACKTSLFRDVEAGAKEEYTIPLYTTPPQRKPLTDEQAMDAYFETPPFGTYKEAFIAGIRFIEAAHGIKGEA